MPRRHMAPLAAPGEVAEWLKAADCKSARASVRWFESSPLHHPKIGSFLPIRKRERPVDVANSAFRRRSTVSLAFPPFSVSYRQVRATWPIHGETGN